MKPQDLILIKLLAASSIVAIITFFYKRSKGTSNSIATWVAGIFFGISLATGVFVSYRQLVPRGSGIGVDIFVVPPAIAIFFTILSGIVALLVFLFGNKNKPANMTPLPPSIQHKLEQARKARTFTRETPSDWRAFARSSYESLKRQ